MQRLTRLVGLLLVFTTLAVGQEPVPAPVPAKEKEDAALLVFYRPKRFFGSGLTPSIYVDAEQIARLDNGRYFALHVKPGKHRIESTMKHAPLEIDVKPDETLYLEMAILAGNWRGGGRIIPAPAEDATALIKKLKPLDKQWIYSDKVVFLVAGEKPAK
jgi:hypothetical protein